MQSHVENEAEETLSLCDLPLYSDEPDSQQMQRSFSSSSSSSSSIDQDIFEFISGGLESAASNFSSADNIFSPDHFNFCAKQIPSKQSIGTNDQFFRRNKSDSSFYNITKSVSSSNIVTTPRSNSLPSPMHRNQTRRSGGKKDILVKREPILTSVTKSRWFLFMFGNMSSVPKKMELSDLRSRQSRLSSPSMLFRSDGGGHEEMVGGNHRATTLWKSSFGCFGGL